MTDLRYVKRAAGALLLAVIPVGAFVAATSPAVRGPAARVVRTLGSDLFPDEAAEVTLAAGSTEGVSPGDAAFLAAPDGSARPVAHVVGVHADALRLRFAPGEDPTGPWRMTVLPRSRTARDAIHLAVPPETASALGEDLRERASRSWREGIAPAVKARVPAFLARLDPERDEETRRVMDEVGDEVLARLEPLGQDLASHVTKALDERFDLLDRMGILWKFVRGDGDGLRRALLPAAEGAARGWWTTNRAAVLAKIGEGVTAKGPSLEAWLGDRVLRAAEEEIVKPVLDAEGSRLEEEARGWIEAVAGAVALSPAGGFRRRFAALLRHQLLDKDDALVLLERQP